MRRLLPSLLRLTAVTAFVAVCILWARSYRRVDAVVVYGSKVRLQGLGSFRGSLILFLSTTRVDPNRTLAIECGSAPVSAFEPVAGFLFEQSVTKLSFHGFRLARGRAGGVMIPPPTYVAITVPHAAAVVTAIPSLLSLRHVIRRRRWGRQGRCTACGYDLRSSPQRCPECGAAPTGLRPDAAGVVVACLLAVASPFAAVGQTTDEKIKDLDLSNVTLEQAFNRIRDAGRFNLVVRWPALAEAGIGRSDRVKLHLWDVKPLKALDILLRAVESDDKPLRSADRDGIITVSTAADLVETELRIYDVRDLLAAMHAQRFEGVPEEKNARVETEDELTRLILDSVDPDSWIDAGGTDGRIHMFAGRLIITQTKEGQRKVEALLKDLTAEYVGKSRKQPVSRAADEPKSPSAPTRPAPPPAGGSARPAPGSPSGARPPKQ